MSSNSAPPASTPSSPQEPPQLVKFLPFRSIADPSFWLQHNQRKLNELRLSEDGVELWGFWGPSVGGGAAATLNAGMRFDASSSSSSSADVGKVDDPKGDGKTNADTKSNARRNEWIRCSGKIYSLNTIESLKKCDKNKFLNEACLPSLLECCGVSRESSSNNDEEDIYEDPNLSLVSSTCLTYCDLKSNMTVYWFAFPALIPRSGCGIAYSSEGSGQQKLVTAWGPKKCQMLSKSFHRFRVSHEKEQACGTSNGHVWCPPFFLLLPEISSKTSSEQTGADSTQSKFMKCLPFNAKVYNGLSDEEKQQIIFGFVDPNNHPGDTKSSASLAVGWTLRNMVAYISLRMGLGGSNATFLSYRPPFLRRIDTSEVVVDVVEDGYVNYGDCVDDGVEYVLDDGADNGDDGGVGESLLLDIQIPLASDYQWTSSSNTNSPFASYRCLGWELNKNNKPGPRSIDLRPLVSPAHLARQANDLNLRLMKWRALPSLDVERLSQLKVVLLGAGTLGCSVARTLLGWGVRNITFVDSGRVSYSNPVRQSLFGIDDCKEGGKFKAVAAAESLVAIAGPDVKSEGVVLTIPMPGHSFGGGKDGLTETEAVKKDVEKLHELIEWSDAVFLLTDTRESRWLPTVMALATGTPLINAALGLDSWLVMRHGPSTTSLQSAVKNSDAQRLGCYFCSDVVAPENSTRDRTLDQQCTVTRPGLAPIAASMATELMVAMFHHPLGHCAPAPEVKKDGSGGGYNPVDDGTSASSSALGLLPHQIRGTVVTYTIMTPTVPSFPSCTACSERVVEEYQKGGFDFVKCVCCDADGSYLEGISGLASFREEAAKKLDDCLDWDDEEEEE